MIKEILVSLDEIAPLDNNAEKEIIWINDYKEGVTNCPHQFVAFLKPEITAIRLGLTLKRYLVLC